jgi:predicted O-linked N-acetylglucosamine transferase (SPINDLY family)
MATISQALAMAAEHRQAGRLQEAEQICRRVLDAEPAQAGAWHLLGVVAYQLGRQEEAIACLRRAIALDAGQAAFHDSLGTALQEQGKLDEAVACYRRALELEPGRAAVCNNLGIALKQLGKLDEAAACHRRTLDLLPNFAGAHNNLGNVLQDLGRPDEAAACHRRAVELAPDYAEAHNSLGYALKGLGQLDEAVACFRRALALRPGYAKAYNNLGNTFADQGRLDEAVAALRRAIELQPDYAEAHSNLLYTLNFCPGYDARAVYEEHRRWNLQHAEPLARLIEPHGNDRSPERRLRVGYVSPDFRGHPVGRFLLPLLQSHDHRQFEIFAYASVLVPDAVTARCRGLVDAWRDASGWSDEQLARAIRADGIDVLVDLTMHMAHGRLLALARKPAPVQVTYLAYCGTTGLTAIDYRLTDPYLDPPGGAERFYSEQSLYLESYWCYAPLPGTPPVEPPPARRAGVVTFGCLNNFCKASGAALDAWARLLLRVPSARLLLHAQPGSHRQAVHERLARQGIAPERVEFSGTLPPSQYHALYGRIDVALDPFPYGGGATTCDALWMGVPVVSLAGSAAVGRGGVSILNNVGLPELIARDEAQYVRIAAELAEDLPRLEQLRATFRARMQGSRLMDAPRFAGDVEDQYREIWRRWCAKPGP